MLHRIWIRISAAFDTVPFRFSEDLISINPSLLSSETEQTALSDQEIDGFAVGYSMGGMSIKAQRNEGEDGTAAGAAVTEVERTEILVGFAF